MESVVWSFMRIPSVLSYAHAAMNTQVCLCSHALSQLRCRPLAVRIMLDKTHHLSRDTMPLHQSTLQSSLTSRTYPRPTDSYQYSFPSRVPFVSHRPFLVCVPLSMLHEHSGHDRRTCGLGQSLHPATYVPGSRCRRCWRYLLHSSSQWTYGGRM